MKYLQSEKLSKAYRYKACIISKTKRRLRLILGEQTLMKYGREKRCGYIGFVYFKKFKDAIKLREKLYSDKDLYVLIQDDYPIWGHYEK